MPSEIGSRVLMIGLDSADLDYIEPRLASLPNLRGSSPTGSSAGSRHPLT